MRLDGLTRKSRSTEPELPWQTRFYTSGVPLPRPIFGLGRDRAALPEKLKLLFIW